MKNRSWFNNNLENFILAIILLTYLIFGLIKIGNVGVQYDEILFGNAALGMIDRSFIRLEFCGIPILLMTYIGALKAWLYTPVFSMFGVSVETIRVPTVIITFFSIIILYILCMKAFNKKIALITILFFALSPSVIEHVRYDVGPNTLELFFKIVALLICFIISETKSLYYAVILCFVIFLGIFNKINFIWFLNSMIAAFLILNVNSLKNRILLGGKKNLLLLITLIVGLGLSYVYYFIIVTQFQLTDKIGLFNLEKIIYINNNLIGILDGQLFYNYLFGNINGIWAPFFVWTIVTIILIGIVLCSFNKEVTNSYQTKFYYFILLNLIFTIVQIYLTKSANKPWHVMTIFPFISILIAYSIYITYVYMKKLRLHLPSSGFKLVNYTFLLITFSLGAYNVFINLEYVEAYNYPVKNANWSAEINTLVNYTKEREEQFIILDWGMHNQLITFTKTKNKYFEVFWSMVNLTGSPLNEPDNVEAREYLFENYIKDNDNRFILHGAETTQFYNPRKIFFDTVREHNMKAVKIKEFNEDGRVIYEIYGAIKP